MVVSGLQKRTGVAIDQRPSTNDCTSASRVNWSYLLEQAQTFCPRLRRMDQARAGAPGAMGDAGLGSGGWLVHGHAAGCNFRVLRVHRPLPLPALCAAGL